VGGLESGLFHPHPHSGGFLSCGHPLPAPFGDAARGEGGGEGVISTASFGGVTGSAGRAVSVQGFGVDSTTTASPLSSGQTSNILWGAAAAAAVGAFVAEWQRKREEAAARAAAEEAARRAADRADRIANLEDKHPAPLSYGERAKAYQRALDNFKADLIASGVDPVKAQALKSQAIVNGSITSVLGKAEEAKEQAKAEKEAEAAKQEAYEAFKEGERDTTAADAWLAQQARAYDDIENIRAARVIDPPPPSIWDIIKKAAADAWETTKAFVQEKVVQPAKDAFDKAVTTAQNIVATVHNKYEEVKKEAIQKWENTKQWMYTHIVQPTKEAWDSVKLYYSPAAELKWDPALRPIESFHQDQYNVTSGTGDVECVTTTVVMVRNIMNEYLAHLSNQSQLPDLTVDGYIKDLDSKGFEELKYRIPSNTPDLSLPIIGPITDSSPAGWMHPRFQMPYALNEFAAEFDREYGYSYTIEQSSGNSYLDIARNVREGNLVIIHGMWNVDPSQTNPLTNLHAWIGGTPHTLGPVISMDANSITILDTGAKNTYTFTRDEFMKFWGEPTNVQVPWPQWLPETLRVKVTPINTYTPPWTMTVITPDAVVSPTSAPASSLTDTTTSTPQP